MKGKITFNILMGLPGSGKSYYANHCIDHYNVMIDLDSNKPETGSNNFKKYIFDYISRSSLKYYLDPYRYPIVVIDGLILTKEQLKETIESCIAYMSNRIDHPDFNFIIHRWKEDREQCLKNDTLRNRNSLSDQTIKYATYDNITVDELNEMFSSYDNISFNIKTHDVVVLNKYTAVFEPKCDYNYKEKKYSEYMYSDSWSGGGDWANCWGNTGTISPEPPVEFEQFDNLLYDIAPNLSFLTYKKIRAACVSTDEYYKHDYYGGCETKLRWSCNMKKLYDMLVEMNLIDN